MGIIYLRMSRIVVMRVDSHLSHITYGLSVIMAAEMLVCLQLIININNVSVTMTHTDAVLTIYLQINYVSVTMTHMDAVLTIYLHLQLIMSNNVSVTKMTPTEAVLTINLHLNFLMSGSQ